MGRTQTSRLVLLAAISGLTMLCACRSLPLPGFGPSSAEKQRAFELQSRLDRYTRDFALTVEQAAEQITDSTADPRVGRATVHWKLTAIPRLKELARMKSQGQALLSLWLFTEAMVYDLEEGAGSVAFGDAQPIAVAASRRLAGEIAGIAGQIIEGEEGFATAQALIHDSVRRSVPRLDGDAPDDGVAELGSVEAGIRQLTSSAGELEWLPEFTLQAFNPFSGLNETAAAVREFTDRASRLVEDTSAEMPWHLELLVYDLEQRATVRDAEASLRRASDGVASLAATAADWPAGVEGVVRTTLDGIDDKQEGLRRTLREAEQALAAAESLVSGLDRTAAQLNAAGEAWGATFQTLGLGADKPPDPNPGEPSRPFDVREYRDTAEELRRTATELRGLVGEVRALTGETGEGTPLGNVEAAARTAAGEARGLADHVAWRLLQLVGAIFLAALAYRALASRLAPRPVANGPSIGEPDA